MADRWLTLADVYQPKSLADLYMAGEQMRQMRMNNQLAQMRLNELTRQTGEENTMRKIYAESVTPGQPAQPQTGTGANISLNAPPTNTLASVYNLGGGAKTNPSFSLGNFSMIPPSADYSSAKPAVPPKFDPSMAVNKLYAAGMPEKAREEQKNMQAGQTEQRKIQMDYFNNIYHPALTQALDNGDNTVYQNIFNQAKRDPKLSGLLDTVIPPSVTGKGEVEMTITGGAMNPKTGKPYTDPFGTPLGAGKSYKLKLRRNGETVTADEVKTPTEAHNTVTKMVNGKPMIYQFNPKTEKYDIPVGEAPKAGINVNVPSPEESSSLAKGIGTGDVSLKDIPARGPARIKIMTEFRKEYPNGSFTKAEANIKYMQDSQNMKTRAYVKTLLPRYEQLRDKAEALKNSDMVSFNKVANWWSQQTGKPEVVDFNSLKNALVQEAESAMTGGNSVTDIRLKMGVENIQHANSPAQLSVAIDNYENALKAKSEAASDVPYPWNEVRGESAPAAPANQPAGGKDSTVNTADDFIKKYGN